MTMPRSAEELFDPDYAKPDPDEAIIGRPTSTINPKQLKRKALSDTAHQLTEEADICELLALPSGAGVRFIARLIESCGWNLPHFHPSNSIMSEVAGRRSIAWQVENWVSDSGLENWFAVRRELEVKRPKPKTSERNEGKR